MVAVYRVEGARTPRRTPAEEVAIFKVIRALKISASILSKPDRSKPNESFVTLAPLQAYPLSSDNRRVR
jgi:hypothetical protein